jgi:hypothetical protein
MTTDLEDTKDVEELVKKSSEQAKQISDLENRLGKALHDIEKCRWLLENYDEEKLTWAKNYIKFYQSIGRQNNLLS